MTERNPFKVIEKMDRAELLETLRTFFPLSDYSDRDTDWLRERVDYWTARTVDGR